MVVLSEVEKIEAPSKRKMKALVQEATNEF